MKVLIAEDNALYRAVLQRHIENWGHEAVVAKDGTAAMEILNRDDAPRLVILDWQMPGMDGIDVCRAVKRDPDHPFTYVVMLTSRDAQEDIVAGLDAGADDYLTKPIEPALLRSRLAAAERIVKLVPPKEWAVPRIDGYDVGEMIGKGVFATVWKAVRQATGETVALKIIRVDLATEDVFGRFAREIELMKRLDHPNIAKIYDSQIDKTLGFYAVELIEGGTLETFVKRQSPKPAALLVLVSKVCDALDHAHQQGVVHRDLKPSNIMMTADGEPKLVDFGLARSMFRAADSQSAMHSMEGTVIGTPLFMSPEQARGRNESIDGRADVYALGIILYVMLLRKHPHKVKHHDPWETIRRIAEEQARPPSELMPGFNRDIERIMMKALASKPEDRYATAGAFGKAILDYLKQQLREQRQKSPK
ncbi:MAG: serine/threonine protein kinase [Planctomycetaceae bacterium]|nr:serine/threonine protein kinase [Planctomycetaceae bacterium]